MPYNLNGGPAQLLRDALHKKSQPAKRKRYDVGRAGFKRRAPHRHPFVVSIFKTVTVPMRAAA